MENKGSITTKKATFLGQISLFIWASSAALTTSLNRLPTYEILSIVFLIGFIFSSLHNTKKEKWVNVKRHPHYIWIIGSISIFCNESFFILSFKNAPAAQVELVNYVWPIMVIIFSSLLPNQKLSFRHVFAGLIALFSIYLLLWHDDSNPGINYEYILGYAYAFCAGLLWAIYTLFSISYANEKSDLVAVYCGICTMLSVVCHLSTEVTMIPSTMEMLVICAMGVTTHSLAYYLWEIGVREGNFKLLSILSYGNPVLSLLILIVFGFSEPTKMLFLSSFLILVAGLIGAYKQ